MWRSALGMRQMADLFGRLRRFLRELRRRNVYKVAVAYLAVAFVGLQAARLLVPATTLPGWADELLIYVAVFGFPVALVLAWAFQMSPEGVRRTSPPEAEVETAAAEPSGRTAGGWTLAGLVLLLTGGGIWYLTGGAGDPLPEETAAKTDTARTSRAHSTPRDRPYVAVLPLENLSPSEENAFFADGIHEEILNQLSKVSGVGVFGRTTMRQYADTERTLAEIGRELGAEAILEGSVRRAAGQVRITTQLIDPESRDHLWSRTYERELSPEAVFDIQADVAQEIAGVLETRLTEAEQAGIRQPPTTTLDAYDAYLKGRMEAMTVWNDRDTTHIGPAIRRLREAVRRDSTFAEARAWLGMGYATRSAFSGRRRWRDSARAAVDRALALDPELPDAYAVRGLVTQIDSPRVATMAYRRALRLDPDHWLASDGMADLAQFEGNYAEAVRWAHRVVRVDPGREWGIAYMGGLLRQIGMDDEAAAWLREVREMNPDNVAAVGELARLHLFRGEIRRAREVVASYRSRRPDHPVGIRLAATVALRSGRPAKAKRLLEEVPETGRDLPANDLARTRQRMLLGFAELRSGRRDRGRALLQEAVESGRGVLEDVPERASRGIHLVLARGTAALGREPRLSGTSARPWNGTQSTIRACEQIPSSRASGTIPGTRSSCAG